MKIGYCLERVDQYVPTPLWCFKCQEYGYHREVCRWWQTYAKCSEKDPDHVEEDCLKVIRCVNCRQDHQAYARSCDVYKKEKEILKVKHKRNVSFLEARKIVRTYMGENSYASVAQRADTIETINIEHSWRNWSSWKRMIGQSFKSTWKDYTRPNVTKHQLSHRLGMGRDPIL